MSRHRVLRAADVRFSEWYLGHAEVATRCSLVDGARGSVHMGLGLCALAAGGRIDVHVQSFEESFFVLEGTPTLVLEDGAHRLPPGACGLVPVGAPHAWLGPESGVARWIEMLAPQPREQGQADTFFLGWLPAEPIRDLDVRDPRMRHLFRLDEGQMDVDVVKSGARVDSPTVSASMPTALLAYSGIAVKILVDQRLGAQLSTMFMVEYQPGGVAHLHDHPFEEAYVLLEGRVEATADGTRYVLEAGDVFWTGVGCVHGFENTSDRTVRWLETQAPQPPARHSYRFNRDWDYLQDALR